MLRRKSSADKPAKAAKAKPAKAPKAAKPAKPAKAKKAKATSVDGIALPKPSTDVFTVMLGVSFLAILIGCLVLWAHIKTYGDFPQWKVPTF